MASGVKIQWKGEALAGKLERELQDRLDLAALEIQRELKQSLNISAKRGAQPSKPGEPPRKRTGFLASNVAIDRSQRWVRKVGVRKNAQYGIALEFGTGPKTIHAKPGKKLMIPVPREKAKELGGKQIKGKWYIFRKSVKHHGIKARPWLRPGFHRVTKRLRLHLLRPIPWLRRR